MFQIVTNLITRALFTRASNCSEIPSCSCCFLLHVGYPPLKHVGARHLDLLTRSSVDQSSDPQKNQIDIQNPTLHLAGRHLGFGLNRNSAIRYADPENRNPEGNVTWIC